MRVLYSALYYSLLPLLVLRMLWRSRLAPAYRRRLPERFGWFPARRDIDLPAIWVHAVSVGEVLAAGPLVEALLRDYPQYRIVLTTTTPTGSERVRALFGDRVIHCYAPFDLAWPVKRFFDWCRPSITIILETELWPNFSRELQLQDIPSMVISGRISSESFKSYSFFSFFFKSVNCL